ncbi:MAG TPA: DUF1501 domain-containing protein [Steroidobacteraceae bacterium]|nr:DUF1501 domain-containing protein [Steroidobacteraceae bacterium]
MAHLLHTNWTRRALLQRAAQLGMAGVATPMLINLAAMGEAAAFDATDYKALVCIFLYGGNDYANTVVPYDATNYAKYNAIRGGAGIAWARNDLTPSALTPVVSQTLTDNLQYALAPPLLPLKALFDTGKLAVQLNVGPLVEPTTLQQYQNQSVRLPPKLFSHNDQQSIWQSSGSEGATTGWGGRMGDLALSNNGTNSLLTCISATGNAVFVAGHNALQYQISTNGAIKIRGLDKTVEAAVISDALNALIAQSSTHAFEEQYAAVTRRSMQMENIVNTALTGVTLGTSFDTDGKPNSLADQLKIVARLIGARSSFGIKRQVFCVSLGGFDHHDSLMEKQPPLLAAIAEAMNAFYQATVELGVANKVTTFTASDFGRTFTPNSDGSDHGWGSHHFVLGGAVQGGRFYGTAPAVSVQTDDQVGQGRLLPSTSVDQFGATLARWFGVSDSELASVLPNIGNFTTKTLGFV